MNANSGYSPKRPLARFVPNPKLKFLDQCREVMRFKQLSHRTEETYLQWIRRYILFHRSRIHPHLTPALSQDQTLTRPPATLSHPMGEGQGAEREKSSGGWIWRHPKDMGDAEVRAFLTDLAVTRRVGAATQNQALNALLFLYREVIGGEMDWIEGFEKARRSQRMPVVLSRPEMEALLGQMSGTPGLIARVLYGTGMRLLVRHHDFLRVIHVKTIKNAETANSTNTMRL